MLNNSTIQLTEGKSPELKQNEELLKSYLQLGKLVESFADSMRNPMTTVQGLLQLVNNHNNEINKQLIKVALDEIKAMDKTINYMLHLSENKRLDKENVNLNELIKCTLDEILENVHDKEYTFQLQLEENLSLILLDKNDIREMLRCALLNGMEALSDQGHLVITTIEENSFILLEIKDNGMGIASSDLSLVYEPFYTTKSDHLGLGLPIIKTILTRNEGSLEIRSTRGVGTTYCVKFFKN